MIRVGWILLLLLWSSAALASAVVDEDTIQRGLRDVAKSLRCTVCQSESVWESNAELARQMREVIKERLARGETPDQIRAYFVGRYGDYILLGPRKRGLNWVIWVAPFLLLAAGGLLLYRSLARWVRLTEPLSSNHPIDEPHRRRIEQELARLSGEPPAESLSPPSAEPQG